MLKATVLAATAHGPSLDSSVQDHVVCKLPAVRELSQPRFQGGQTWLSKQEVAKRFIEKHKHNTDKLVEIAELIRSDVGYEIPSEEVPRPIWYSDISEIVKKHMTLIQ